MRMAHVKSTTMYGGIREKEDPLQGLFQGNGAGPAGWVGASSMIIQHQRAQGNGAKVTKYISLYLLLLVSPLYVYYG